MPYRPVVLVILDGWGISASTLGNAIAQANKPCYDRLMKQYPHTQLQASGEEVGLPAGQMGNSEVGHLNIGAGRIVYQELTRIHKAIKDGEFRKNPVLLEAFERAAAPDKALHLLGLLSDGGVHSHIEHLFALLEMAAERKLSKVYLHILLDGRDVPPANAKEYIIALEAKLQDLGIGKIATVMGRYYAMDRDKRWDRVGKAYQAMVAGKGHLSNMALAAVERAYEVKQTDEFVEPSVIVDEKGQPAGLIKPGDVLIMFNFRADRARQISHAFTDKDFNSFERPGGCLNLHYVSFTQYDITLKTPVAFPPQNLDNTLGEVLSKAGKRQVRIAETEKYAHVTFFFNGGLENPYPQEERILVPSPQVATYNLQPEMSAVEITDKALEAINSGIYDFMVINYANPDMVGHTGIMDAAVSAIETVDKCLDRLTGAVLSKGGVVVITADHGNAECMVDKQSRQMVTAHTSNTVPFILVGEDLRNLSLHPGSLEDIAPTVLALLGLAKPAEMTGKVLLKDWQT